MPKHSAQRPSSPTPSDLSIASSYWDQLLPSDTSPSNNRTLSHRPSSPTLGHSPQVTIRPEPKPLSSYAVSDPRWEADSQGLHRSVSAEQVARLRRVKRAEQGLDGEGQERMRVLKRSDHVPSRKEWPVEKRREGKGGIQGVRRGRVEFESATPPRVDSAKDMSRDSAMTAGRTGEAPALPKVRVQVLPETASDRKVPKKGESVMGTGPKVKSGSTRVENTRATKTSRAEKAGPGGHAQAMYTVRVKVVVPETSPSEKHRLRRVRASNDLSAAGVRSGK